jgi:Clr5 domain
MSSLSLNGGQNHKSSSALAGSVRYFGHNGSTAVNSSLLESPGLQCPPDILPPTSDEWESKKDIIEDLYIRKRMKLTDVKHRMEMLHGFKAK